MSEVAAVANDDVQAIETDPILTENTAETNVVAQCTDEAEKKRKLSSAPVDASAIFTKVDNNGQEEFRAKLTDKGMKRLTVSSYRGAKTIHIREYYEKDGKEMPGKKGIMMTMPQFEALRKTLTDGSFDWACDQIEVNKEPEKKAKKQKKEKKAEKKELDEDEE
ncbi:hypothetical protein TrLO_g10728 [Triparma laevis f. longispina]|uniref:Transcriptional coactivator p15 (PC4) C-terminal domain-containing protein n=1 Tax=Triparma laevis f. longispina TaxID=1714387 RepID=A0A9W7C671_9STRA|nr:hypothetical protein TrLO_g10728 [Triparma laevis f. longispina]